MYSIVFRDGIMTSHITLTPDWINYALMNDITDGSASPIQTVEYEVDSIEELVLSLRENETSDMLRQHRILL
ncbi:CorA metal ion transporter [Mortierella sp. NVP85]|nr:CorA metal ion transporter [Mortierella sp. NVP85]